MVDVRLKGNAMLKGSGVLGNNVRMAKGSTISFGLHYEESRLTAIPR